ncbi:MAG: uncharacterized protein KVP18_004904 [Porospora cf. gigantea A]|uniref:uncharacterized protein n=1 Tax=Porospora cf. gigantea A TaxID=2853593 RepID=UPI00355A1CA7|nr:MAG: hypothetical protein KVP18_004904 [Porospora cf. gigantea A]
MFAEPVALLLEPSLPDWLFPDPLVQHPDCAVLSVSHDRLDLYDTDLVLTGSHRLPDVPLQVVIWTLEKSYVATVWDDAGWDVRLWSVDSTGLHMALKRVVERPKHRTFHSRLTEDFRPHMQCDGRSLVVQTSDDTFEIFSAAAIRSAPMCGAAPRKATTLQMHEALGAHRVTHCSLQSPLGPVADWSFRRERLAILSGETTGGVQGVKSQARAVVLHVRGKAVCPVIKEVKHCPPDAFLVALVGEAAVILGPSHVLWVPLSSMKSETRTLNSIGQGASLVDVPLAGRALSTGTILTLAGIGMTSTIDGDSPLGMTEELFLGSSACSIHPVSDFRALLAVPAPQLLSQQGAVYDLHWLPDGLHLRKANLNVKLSAASALGFNSRTGRLVAGTLPSGAPGLHSLSLHVESPYHSAPKLISGSDLVSLYSTCKKKKAKYSMELISVEREVEVPLGVGIRSIALRDTETAFVCTQDAVLELSLVNRMPLTALLCLELPNVEALWHVPLSSEQSLLVASTEIGVGGSRTFLLSDKPALDECSWSIEKDTATIFIGGVCVDGQRRVLQLTPEDGHLLSLEGQRVYSWPLTDSYADFQMLNRLDLAAALAEQDPVVIADALDSLVVTVSETGQLRLYKLEAEQVSPLKFAEDQTVSFASLSEGFLTVVSRSGDSPLEKVEVVDCASLEVIFSTRRLSLRGTWLASTTEDPESQWAWSPDAQDPATSPAPCPVRAVYLVRVGTSLLLMAHFHGEASLIYDIQLDNRCARCVPVSVQLPKSLDLRGEIAPLTRGLRPRVLGDRVVFTVAGKCVRLQMRDDGQLLGGHFLGCVLLDVQPVALSWVESACYFVIFKRGSLALCVTGDWEDSLPLCSRKVLKGSYEKLAVKDAVLAVVSVDATPDLTNIAPMSALGALNCNRPIGVDNRTSFKRHLERQARLPTLTGFKSTLSVYSLNGSCPVRVGKVPMVPNETVTSLKFMSETAESELQLACTTASRGSEFTPADGRLMVWSVGKSLVEVLHRTEHCPVNCAGFIESDTLSRHIFLCAASPRLYAQSLGADGPLKGTFYTTGGYATSLATTGPSVSVTDFLSGVHFLRTDGDPSRGSFGIRPVGVLSEPEIANPVAVE